ncbi:MFS transporter [Furfurilactobacillus siliginis]|uniref:Major facilitator superfamily protein n=1 Tax=Furfurilactobacillus siliginis TaxID=348151 RepID=A0A0R2L766_9LACO|nr:MFS transporter [Furfurilactobacillus siliginis]KRN97248.1 major facilitator superfamily protein [Furfurilactobacillus siliginis]GEK29446.1 multidrug resistance protein [Furfurilactobacillus siliginis]
MAKKEQWQKNLNALWIGNFVTGAGASMSLPFLPLFISTMGHFPKWELTLYAGLAFSITFLSQAIVSPLWGKLADRTGRKPMLLRASIGMTITATLTGFSPNVWVLIGLRLIQGAFSGYINNAYALIASEVPMEKSGKTMGTLTTGAVGGQLVGPIIGGYIADLFGFRVPFFIFGALMLIGSLVTFFYVKEDFKPLSSTKTGKATSAFANVKHVRVVWAMILSSMLIQAATTSINPIISLFVKELMQGRGNVAVASGVIAALPGIATLVAAPRLGALGDHVGPQRVLIAGLIFCGLMFIPMFFVTTVVMLGVFRFLVGISDAALLPVTQTVMTLNTPEDAISRIFSYNQSAQAIGSVIGPMLAAGVAGVLDYRYVFLMTTGLVLVNLVMVLWAYRTDNTDATSLNNE